MKKTISTLLFVALLLLTSTGVCGMAADSYGSAAPVAPSSMEAKADPLGLMKVTVSFIAPMNSSDGYQLNSISKIELFRDNDLVTVLSDVNPGQECRYIDTTVPYGHYVYSAVAYCGGLKGEIAFADKVFVGVDVPLPPIKVSVADMETKFVFTWPKVDSRGVNGERVRPEGVTYRIYELNASYEKTKQLAETASRTYTLFVPTDLGEQDIVRYGVCAVNTAGESEPVYVRVVKGCPYALPFKESFAGGVVHGLCWQEGDGEMGVTPGMSEDDDYGCLAVVPDGSNPLSFNLGKISMRGSVHPRLSFKCFGLGKDEKLSIKVMRPDGAEARLLDILGPLDEWTEYTVDLGEVKNALYLIPKFQLAKGNCETVMFDDIRVKDPYETDLAVALSAPETAHGKTLVTVTVTNEGLLSCDNAKILLYNDGSTVGEVEVSSPLDSGESKIIETDFLIGKPEKGMSVEIEAIVVWVYDLNPANDKATAEILYDGEYEINEVSKGSTVVSDEKSDKTVYGINGINYHSATLTPGFYILNGRKVRIRK